jgi:hypothetical protein
MTENGLKPSVVRLLDRAHQQVSDFLNEFPEEDRARVKRPDRWAPKDLLIHLLGWNVRMNRRMAGLPVDGSPDESEGLNRINAAIFEDNRGRSWEDLFAEDRQAFADLLRTVEAMSEEDLTLPGRLAWAGTRPAWMALLGNGHWHPYHHLCMYLVERGEVERATAIQEGITRDLVALGQGDQHKGTTLYNLACFYALTHRPREAIGLLREALPLAPGLVEWSKQDTDLDSLREDHGFKALYA